MTEPGATAASMIDPDAVGSPPRAEVSTDLITTAVWLAATFAMSRDSSASPVTAVMSRITESRRGVAVIVARTSSGLIGKPSSRTTPSATRRPVAISAYEVIRFSEKRFPS